jgi:DNA replication protein DnaC
MYYRMPRLFAALALVHGDGRYAKLLRALSRIDLLVLDDWGPEVLNAEQRRDLLEIVEDRYDRHSLLIMSQIPITQWYDMIGNPTLADAILDRIIHNAYRIELSGDSLRECIGDSDSTTRVVRENQDAN